MSLETLLEAAEFLESRGKDAERHRHRTLSDKRTNSFSDASSIQDDNEFNDLEEKGHKETKSKNKSGKLSPIYVGPPDSFFTCMRAGTREVHNKLEKNRRAHLKECFDFLKKNIPSLEDKRTSNLGILRSSLRYIQNLKRREREYELEMQKFARDKIILQEKMRGLKDELNKMDIEVDLNAWISTAQDHDNETNSTSTATERGTPPPSDFDENDDDEEEAERLVLEMNPSPTPKTNKGTSNTARPLVPIAIPKTTAIPTVNGVVPKVNQILMKTPPKKTIPITLSLSGPVQPVSYMASTQGTVPDPGAASRTPVTQLLHRTLTQRQALMKQTTVSSAVSSAPLTAAQLKSPPLSHAVIPVTLNSSTMSSMQLPATNLVTSVSENVTSVALSKQTPSVAGTAPLSVPYYMASVQKIANPILVTSLMAPAVGLSTSTASTSSATSSVASTAGVFSMVPDKTELKVDNYKTVTTQTPLNFLPAPVVASQVTQPDIKTSSATVPIRPIFAPNLLSGWPLLTTIPRSTVVVPSSNVQVSQSNISTSVAPNTSTSVPLVSLGQLNQLSQMVGPMTVMSSGIQMSQSSLNPNPLSTMFSSSPLLKQILPLGIPSSLLQSGQVLGQVKPVVVVTVPNVVTQNPVTLASIALATTSS